MTHNRKRTWNNKTRRNISKCRNSRRIKRRRRKIKRIAGVVFWVGSYETININ